MSVLTEEQFQSLFGVETTSIAIAELLRSRSNNVDEEEIIEYYPASMVPAGPILQGQAPCCGAWGCRPRAE